VWSSYKFVDVSEKRAVRLLGTMSLRIVGFMVTRVRSAPTHTVDLELVVNGLSITVLLLLFNMSWVQVSDQKLTAPE
jgi:hypothetical protein